MALLDTPPSITPSSFPSMPSFTDGSVPLSADPEYIEALIPSITQNIPWTAGAGSMLHSAYRNYKEARANGSSVMGSIDNFALGGISAGIRISLMGALAGTVGLSAATGVVAGVAVNEGFNRLTQGREENMRLDKKMKTLTWMIYPIRQGVRWGLNKTLGEKIFPREHFGKGEVSPGTIEKKRNKDQYLKSEGVQNFLKAIKITQSKGQVPDAEGNLPYQKLRDALSAYIPGYDQDDIRETTPDGIIENILRKAVNTDGGLLAGKSKKEVLEAIEEFGNRIYVYDDIQTLLSDDIVPGGSIGGGLLKYQIFENPDNEPLLDSVISGANTKNNQIRTKLSSIIDTFVPSISSIFDISSTGKIKTLLKNNPIRFLRSIEPATSRESILNDFFITEQGGIFKELLQEKLEDTEYINIDNVPPQQGGMRSFNEKHDTSLGGKKYGVKGVMQSIRESFSALGQKKYFDEDNNEQDFSASDKAKMFINLVPTLLAGKELYDLSAKFKNKSSHS